ncbi:MAG: hypothetical protein C4555_03915 [Dehalococcoidia bacterium]|nr:MAG: hypothetical protein C4555_03915 [Dehalococcoidia bacterium]
MEYLLAALQVLGIFVVAPILVGLTIVKTLEFWGLRTVRRASSNLTCSVDADCPQGFVCVGGRCIPLAEARLG